MSFKEKCWPVFMFFKPSYPQSRVAALKEAIKIKGYPVGQKRPNIISEDAIQETKEKDI